MGAFDFIKKKDEQKISGNELDINVVSKWIDGILEQSISEGVKAFYFNLYDDGDNKWSMELIGTGNFDVDDADWACDEIEDYGTRTNPFAWSNSEQWDKVLEEVICVLNEYLEKGKYSEVLKSKCGVGVGFVDGDIVILHKR